MRSGRRGLRLAAGKNVVETETTESIPGFASQGDPWFEAWRPHHRGGLKGIPNQSKPTQRQQKDYELVLERI